MFTSSITLFLSLSQVQGKKILLLLFTDLIRFDQIRFLLHYIIALIEV